ncbi:MULTISPECIES: hypothetical protein [Novacetimonas]|uniref:DUF3618 domain-containing protein n=2 Tax=Novacetimonas TaxID=2919364 RepID=A0A318Q8Z4_9PROT|nr:MULTISPECIES: hypothetical protein [Novacetimonas]MBV1834401.1 hypothetical protein [Novacetimonas pomaceti]PYD46684.1 hypothetical protein C3920_13895 [Novacetimonas pomaceti]PYD75355.1 hypothetical protein CFR71_09690 [Novacetimonas pomaceti]RBM06046.1 hypothetical protein NJLHNGOC_11265 [Novacetimonas cocois]
MTKTDIKHVTHEDLQALKSHVENLLHSHGKQALHSAVEKAEHLASNAREIAESPAKPRSRGRSFLAIAIFSAIGYFLGRATK